MLRIDYRELDGAVGHSLMIPPGITALIKDIPPCGFIEASIGLVSVAGCLLPLLEAESWRRSGTSIRGRTQSIISKWFDGNEKIGGRTQSSEAKNCSHRLAFSDRSSESAA